MNHFERDQCQDLLLHQDSLQVPRPKYYWWTLHGLPRRVWSLGTLEWRPYFHFLLWLKRVISSPTECAIPSEYPQTRKGLETYEKVSVHEFGENKLERPEGETQEPLFPPVQSQHLASWAAGLPHWGPARFPMMNHRVEHNKRYFPGLYQISWNFYTG